MNPVTSVFSNFLTLDEYFTLDHGPKEDASYELVNGILVEMPPESDQNNDIAKRLLFELAKHFPIHLLAHKDTEVEVTGQRATCRIPDLLVHTDASKAALSGTRRATLTHDMPPPALVIEIVSPGKENRDRDYRYKRTEYAARGIAEYWIVDPETQHITLCQWDNGQYEDKVYRGSESIESVLASAFSLTPQTIFSA